MPEPAVYERIGAGYRDARRADPRIAARINAALGDARRIVNIGAGTGNYEPLDRELLVAVEPALAMLQQRATAGPPAVRAAAESLPFRSDSFDAALAVLTIHHWRDLATGLAEMCRVASRQVLFMFDVAMTDQAWLITYFPEVLDLASEQAEPSIPVLREHLDVGTVEVVPVPADCSDGFAGCYWNRPEAYLDSVVRAGMSSFSQLDDAIEARGVARLRAALDSGEWDDRYGELRALTEYDVGYRLVISGRSGDPDE